MAILDELTEEERELAKTANTHITGSNNEARVVTDLWVAHRMRGMADDMIDANKKLAKASGDTAEALNKLTGRLVIVTALLGIVGLVQAWIIWNA